MHRLARLIGFILWIGLPLILPAQGEWITRQYRGDVLKWPPDAWAFAEGKQGFLYAGMSRGILEYDGHQWRQIPLPEQRFVRALAADTASGRIYVGASGEVGYLTPDPQGLMYYVSLRDSFVRAGVPAGEFWQVVCTPEAIWFLTDQHLIRWAAGRIQILHTAGRFFRMGYAGGLLWVYDELAGLQILQPDLSLSTVQQRTGTTQEAVFDLIMYKPGRWLLLQAQSVSTGELVHTPAGWVFSGHILTLPAELQQAKWYKAHAIPGGGWALASLNQGLYLGYDDTGECSHLQSARFQLPDDRIHDLMMDRHGWLWVATQQGIGKVAVQSDIAFWGSQAGLNGKIRDMEVWNGHLYLGTSQGLYRMAYPRGRRVETVHQAEVWDIAIWDETPGASHLLVATSAGLWDQAEQQYISDELVLKVLPSRRSPGLIYLGAYNRPLQQMTRIGNHWEKTSLADSPSLAVYSLLEDPDGRLWIGTAFDGIYRRDTTGEMHHFGTQDGLPALSELHLFQMGDKVITDSPSGIWVWHEASNQFKPDTTFSFTGLSPRPGVRIGRVAGATLWVSLYTDKDGTAGRLMPGVSGAYQFEPLGSGAGQHIWDGVFWAEGDSAVWSGSTEGVYRHRLAPASRGALQVFLRKIAVGPGRSVAAEGALVKTPAEPPAWAWEASPVVFSFATNIPGDEGSIRYRYRLEGLESGWSDWQTEPVVKLGRIPEGRYTLQIEAIDQQGRISQPAEVSFVIYPPWYRSPLALAAYGLGAMLLIAGLMWGYGLALSRRNHLLEQEVLRRTRDAELAREEAVEASKAKSLFLASMSHEIRTPMNGVLGMTELLMDTGPNEEQQEYINTIRVSGENLLTIINDILDYSKIESGSMELEERPIPIRAWVAEVLELFGEKAARAGLELYAQVHDEVPEVIAGDDTRLRQIVINLINNALKFTEKGQVELVVSMVAPLIPGEDACKLRFEVRDSGIGIPEHKLDRLFKVYSQTDASTARTHGGTGLGLAISQELVILMGGAITVSSKVGQGSTFAFTIQSRVMPETGPAPYVQYALAGIKLLLLDDHAGSRAAQAAQLRRAGADVTEAGSLAEARQILANTTFQAIVTDLEMPGGNGILLAQEMQGRGVPVLLMSTPLHFRPFRTRKDLFTAVISKPVRPDNLLRMVHRAVFQDHNEIAMPQGQHDPAETSRLADAFPLRLLVAEDNAVNQRLITKILAKMGYEVRLASNGAEAVAALRKERYDVVLMDVQMPEMDGLAATKMIRSELAYQPVIVAMTANAMQGDREMCIEAGMNDYVSKPFKQQELIEMLQKYGLEKQIREALQQA